MLKLLPQFLTINGIITAIGILCFPHIRYQAVAISLKLNRLKLAAVTVNNPPPQSEQPIYFPPVIYSFEELDG